MLTVENKAEFQETARGEAKKNIDIKGREKTRKGNIPQAYLQAARNSQDRLEVTVGGDSRQASAELDSGGHAPKSQPSFSSG